MKKLLAVFMIAGLFGFAACSGSEQPAEDATTNAMDEATEASTDNAMEAVSEADATMQTADSTMAGEAADAMAGEEGAAEGDAAAQ